MGRAVPGEVCRLHRVVIVGGGISGLAAAYYLERQAGQARIDVSIELLEARNRPGGVIVTERQGEFLVEGGPRLIPSTVRDFARRCRAFMIAL